MMMKKMMKIIIYKIHPENKKKANWIWIVKKIFKRHWICKRYQKRSDNLSIKLTNCLNKVFSIILWIKWWTKWVLIKKSLLMISISKVIKFKWGTREVVSGKRWLLNLILIVILPRLKSLWWKAVIILAGNNNNKTK